MCTKARKPGICAHFRTARLPPGLLGTPGVCTSCIFFLICAHFEARWGIAERLWVPRMCTKARKPGICAHFRTARLPPGLAGDPRSVHKLHLFLHLCTLSDCPATSELAGDPRSVYKLHLLLHLCTFSDRLACRAVCLPWERPIIAGQGRESPACSKSRTLELAKTAARIPFFQFL